MAVTPWLATTEASSTTGFLSLSQIWIKPKKSPFPCSLLENGAVMAWNLTMGSFYHNRAVLFQDGLRLQWINQLFVDDGYLWMVSNRCDLLLSMIFWETNLGYEGREDVKKSLRILNCPRLSACVVLFDISGFTSSRGPSSKRKRWIFEFSVCVSKMAVPITIWASTCQKPQYSASNFFP